METDANSAVILVTPLCFYACISVDSVNFHEIWKANIRATEDAMRHGIMDAKTVVKKRYQHGALLLSAAVQPRSLTSPSSYTALHITQQFSVVFTQPKGFASVKNAYQGPAS
jgi:hypothetical protein